jgi:spore coat polysaccharide biosynthesis predicted glycosyltransferase SpsG/CMP-N-acetylneuraminic acid synthetase
MREFAVIIPAIKKNVAFPNDLVKRLGGVTLIQRAINKAKGLAADDDIYVVTDSEEICLICKRNGINFTYREGARLKTQDIIHELRYFLLRIYNKYNNLIFVYAYTPTVNSLTIKDAYEYFLKEQGEILVSVMEIKHRIYTAENSNLIELISLYNSDKLLVEVKSFLIAKADLINKRKSQIKFIKYALDENTVEIKNYQDWWICEKLFRRKKIIFRVIGYSEVGMGHIYRSLALAHEITDHEITFACDEKSRLAVNQIAGMDYQVMVYPAQVLEEEILRFRPDMVINDILDTSSDYVRRLKEGGCKVVNFEDLGRGAALADLTINELYDKPVIPGSHIRWGHQYFFLREEFIDAKPRLFHDPVKTILFTFGGTDAANLTMQSLRSVADICRERNLSIYVVGGPGYAYKNELANYIDSLGYNQIQFTFATGVISGIMEQTDLAICSNGRTVYELGHMNIPSLVIAHHEREANHVLACEENGFINLGVYQPSTLPELLRHHLVRLLTERDFRKKLYDRTKRLNFLKNKSKVLSLLGELLSSEPD